MRGLSSCGYEKVTTIPTFITGNCRASHRPTSSRVLPRDWKDLARQISVWLSFVLGYEVISSLAGGRPAEAFANGRRVVSVENALPHGLLEVTLQRIADSSRVLSDLAVWTYWNSEFTVMSVALLWVYLRRYEAFARLRNTILLTNLVGLVIYFVLPTAPPRFCPELGIADTLARVGGPDRDDGLLSFAANPYAAMPSLHAADALLVGAGLALLVRRRLLKALWLVWPAWVWFCVIATGNHFALDVAAGAGVAVASAAALNGRALSRYLASRRFTRSSTPRSSAVGTRLRAATHVDHADDLGRAPALGHSLAEGRVRG